MIAGMKLHQDLIHLGGYFPISFTGTTRAHPQKRLKYPHGCDGYEKVDYFLLIHLFSLKIPYLDCPIIWSHIVQSIYKCKKTREL